MVEIYGTTSYCCNSGTVTGKSTNGGIVGNNRGNISFVYNIATKIESREDYTGGIVGIQNENNIKKDVYIKNSYNKCNIVAKGTDVGGIVGTLSIGKVDNTYNMGILEGTTNVAQIAGGKSGDYTITNSGKITEAEMISWSQQTINTKLGVFIKKANSLPILNITIGDITF